MPPLLPDKPAPWVLDFNQPMRPKTRAYVKISYGVEVHPGHRRWNEAPSSLRRVYEGDETAAADARAQREQDER